MNFTSGLYRETLKASQSRVVEDDSPIDKIKTNREGNYQEVSAILTAAINPLSRHDIKPSDPILILRDTLAEHLKNNRMEDVLFLLETANSDFLKECMNRYPDLLNGVFSIKEKTAEHEVDSKHNATADKTKRTRPLQEWRALNPDEQCMDDDAISKQWAEHPSHEDGSKDISHDGETATCVEGRASLETLSDLQKAIHEIERVFRRPKVRESICLGRRGKVPFDIHKLKFYIDRSHLSALIKIRSGVVGKERDKINKYVLKEITRISKRDHRYFFYLLKMESVSDIESMKNQVPQFRDICKEVGFLEVVTKERNS